MLNHLHGTLGEQRLVTQVAEENEIQQVVPAFVADSALTEAVSANPKYASLTISCSAAARVSSPIKLQWYPPGKAASHKPEPATTESSPVALVLVAVVQEVRVNLAWAVKQSSMELASPPMLGIA